MTRLLRSSSKCKAVAAAAEGAALLRVLPLETTRQAAQTPQAAPKQQQLVLVLLGVRPVLVLPAAVEA
jgi:hypothetical protein